MTEENLDICAQCGTFGPIYDRNLCELCYEDEIEAINNPKHDDGSDDDDDRAFDFQMNQLINKRNISDISIFQMRYTWSKECGNNEKENYCPVCLDELKIGDQVTTLPCAHTFHYTCVSDWLEQSEVCPLCRTNIVAEMNK